MGSLEKYVDKKRGEGAHHKVNAWSRDKGWCHVKCPQLSIRGGGGVGHNWVKFGPRSF